MNKTSWQNLTRGIIRENPVLVMMLGMCPTLGVTTSATNGLGMGIATLLVLCISNVLISAVKNFIPDTVRIPCYIVIIASCVTVIEMLMEAYLPLLYGALGIYIPLIVVNCIILGRAEAFAAHNNMIQSLLDAIGMGTGFTLSLAVLGLIRELLGSYSIFGYALTGADVEPILMFIMPPGAFLTLAGLMLIFNKMKGQK
ncbi:MAG: electron transport complex subunit E [Alphaproteobacteria bacterium]|nr:electron transport complex subunit E [Alphaproteobacteria bacterium]